MITTILFDLDGTLLPMDQDVFVKSYFKELAIKLIPHGYDPKTLTDAIWGGTAAMVKNDGSRLNKDAFWEFFCRIYGEAVRKDEPIFEEFYRVEFQKAASSCGFNPEAAKTVTKLKESGFRVALATNPLFPEIATKSRIQWAGLSPSDFELYTTYENSHYCKPNPDYYQEVISALGCRAEECLMVGNDVAEDMVAQTLGMSVFLLTDCLINKEEKDISVYPHGSFAQLLEYTASLPR